MNILVGTMWCLSLSIMFLTSGSSSSGGEPKYEETVVLDYWGVINPPSKTIYIFDFSEKEVIIKLDQDNVGKDFKISVVLTEMVCRISEASTTHLSINGGEKTWCETLNPDDSPLVFDGTSYVTIETTGNWGEDSETDYYAKMQATAYYAPDPICHEDKSFFCPPCGNSGYCINEKLKCDRTSHCRCDEDEKDDLCYPPVNLYGDDGINMWLYVGPIIGSIFVLSVVLSIVMVHRRRQWHKRHKVVGVVIAGGAVAAVITERRQQPTAPQIEEPAQLHPQHQTQQNYPQQHYPQQQYPHQQYPPQHFPQQNPPPYSP